MKDHVEIIQEQGPSSTRQFAQDTVCHQCKQMLKLTSKLVTNVNIPRPPLEYLISMIAPWPFVQWGLDILGSFPIGTRKMKFLMVGIYYFTKWVEAEPLAKLTEQKSETSFGRISSAVLEFLGCSSQTMDARSTTHPLENSMSNQESGITTPRPPTHRPMDRQKLQTDPY